MGDAASPKWLPETGRALLTEDEVSWSIPTGFRFISFILEGREQRREVKKRRETEARAFLFPDCTVVKEG